MLPIVDAALNIIGKVIDIAGIEVARAPFERVRKIKLEIINEKALGDLADQAKISQLYQELQVDMDTLDQEVEAGLKATK